MYSKAAVTHVGNGLVAISGPCVVTGRPFAITVSREALKRYLDGAFAQDAFPELAKEDREFIVSGTSPQGWIELFGNKLEEGEEILDVGAVKQQPDSESRTPAMEAEALQTRWANEKREDVWLMVVASASIGRAKDARQIAQWADQVLEQFDRRFPRERL